MKTYAAQFCLALSVLFSPAVSFAAADLEVYKFGPSTVVAGTDLLYEISVYNAGPDPATNVAVTDVFALPLVGEGGGGPANCSDGNDNDTDGRIDPADDECDGLVFVGATAPCSLTAVNATEGTLSCALGSLGVGESSTFTIKFHVSPGYLATKEFFVTDEATVSATEADPDAGDNTHGVYTIVEEVADLRITKFVEPTDTVLAGTIITYTIYVDNFGPSAARNVTIRDAVLNSDDLAIQSCAFSVSQGAGSITQFTCTTGPVVQTQFGTDIATFRTDILYPLTPSSQGRLRGSFRMIAETDMDITNTTRVTSETFDPLMANNEADVNIDVIPVTDLSLFAVFGAEVQIDGEHGRVIDPNAVLPPMPEMPNYNFGGTTVTAGRRIEFSAGTVTTGPSPANNVQIEFLLPAGVSVLAGTVTSSPNPGTAPGRCYTEPAGEPRRTVICQYDTLEEGQTAAARFQVLVDHDVPDGTQLSIEALTRSDEFDPGLSDNVTSLQFDVNNWADLGLWKFAVGSAIAGEDFHYELQISNAGASTAHDVTLRDFLPPGVTFVDAFVDHEGTSAFLPLSCGVTSGSNVLFCPLGDIPPTGAVPILVFVNVHVQPDVAGGTPLFNFADLMLSDTPDPFTGDNFADVQSEVTARADLELVKTAGADIYAPSARIDFVLTVTNNGPSAASDVVVTDTLPLATVATYVSDSGGCVLAGTTLTCDVGTLANGESRSITVYMLPKGRKGRITNTATVSSSTDDADSSNNTSSRTILVRGGKASRQGR